jgi:ATP-dependent Zn protease
VKAFLLESGESLKEVAIDIFTFLKARFRTYYLVLLGVAIALFPTEKYYSEQELFSMLEDQNKVTNIKLVTVEERSSSYQMLSFEVDGQKGYLFVENINLLLEKLRQRYPNMPINPEKKTALERKAEFLQQISKVGYMYGLLAIYGILLYKLSKNAGGGMGGNPLGDKVGKQRFDMTKQTNVKFASVAGLK